jgi:hypothetical protein
MYMQRILILLVMYMEQVKVLEHAILTFLGGFHPQTQSHYG